MGEARSYDRHPFRVLFIVDFAVIPTPLDVDASAIEVHAYSWQKQDGIPASMVVVIAALFFFISFLGSLRSALRETEGGTGRVSSIASPADW